MNLIVDIGNTHTKLFVLEDGTPICSFSVKGEWSGELLELKNKYKINACAAICVGAKKLQAEEILQELQCPVYWVTGETLSPIKVLYKTPHTLGADRLAAVVGATVLYPSQNLLVIDIGTCITYDFVDAANNYIGGNISLGMDMRFAALHNYTASLPLVTFQRPNPGIGYNTETAIRSGVVCGIKHEIEGYIQESLRKTNDLRVVITGGGAEYVASFLDTTVILEPYLVAIGVNEILEYQAKFN